MKRRRSRFFREDVIAPWAAMGVIVGFWWLSALVIGRGATPTAPTVAVIPPVSASPGRSAPRDQPPPTARTAADPDATPSASHDVQPRDQTKTSRMMCVRSGKRTCWFRSTG